MPRLSGCCLLWSRLPQIRLDDGLVVGNLAGRALRDELSTEPTITSLPDPPGVPACPPADDIAADGAPDAPPDGEPAVDSPPVAAPDDVDPPPLGAAVPLLGDAVPPLPLHAAARISTDMVATKLARRARIAGYPFLVVGPDVGGKRAHQKAPRAEEVADRRHGSEVAQRLRPIDHRPEVVRTMPRIARTVAFRCVAGKPFVQRIYRPLPRCTGCRTAVVVDLTPHEGQG